MKLTVKKIRQGLLLQPTMAWCRARGIRAGPDCGVPREACVVLEGNDADEFMKTLEAPIRNDLEAGWCLAIVTDAARCFFNN